MAIYEKIFRRFYPNGWKNKPTKSTPIKAEALDNYDAAIEHIEEELVNHYSAFAEKEEIPKKVSQLENDKNYVTDDQVANIPTKVSDLENDAEYVTLTGVESVVNDKMSCNYVSKYGDSIHGELEMENSSILFKASGGTNSDIQMTADADSTVGIEMKKPSEYEGSSPFYSKLTERELIIGYKDGYINDNENTTRVRINDTYMYFEDTDGWVGRYDWNGMYINDSTFVIQLAPCSYVMDENYFYNTYDGATLGMSSHKWDCLYAKNGTIQTSDRNAKKDILEMTAEQAQGLIYGLKPSTYKMNAGTSGRTHWGMISQDIEELLEALGMTSLDFAGFIKSPKVVTEEVTDERGKTKLVETAVDGEYEYSLRYDEFIAPIIKVVQEQHKQIRNLEERLTKMEGAKQNEE